MFNSDVLDSNSALFTEDGLPDELESLSLSFLDSNCDALIIGDGMPDELES